MTKPYTITTEEAMALLGWTDSTKFFEETFKSPWYDAKARFTLPNLIPADIVQCQWQDGGIDYCFVRDVDWAKLYCFRICPDNLSATTTLHITNPPETPPIPPKRKKEPEICLPTFQSPNWIDTIDTDALNEIIKSTCGEIK